MVTVKDRCFWLTVLVDTALIVANQTIGSERSGVSSTAFMVEFQYGSWEGQRPIGLVLVVVGHRKVECNNGAAMTSS